MMVEYLSKIDSLNPIINTVILIFKGYLYKENMYYYDNFAPLMQRQEFHDG